MEFKKYVHVERYGTTEVEGIDEGTCYIFPKIDGTNSQLFMHEGVLQAGSRNRQLALDNDNHGFYNWAVQQDNLKAFFVKYPDVRLYGEWLIPHSLKTYQDSAWRNFYVFDVELYDRFLNYEVYKDMLEEFNIQYIPPICKVENSTYDRIIDQLQKNTYLIKDGQGTGEGIVIKNYNFVNKYGRVTWAKIVTNEFKAKHTRVAGTQNITEVTLIEHQIVDKYITLSLCEKEYAKIDDWSSKKIPQLLNTVYYCLIVEECWNFVKDHKQPTINFKTLMSITFRKVKELMPQLF